MRAARGFTLVELLAALFALALLAMLSWQGLDGMIRARQITEARADEVLALQTGLAQWVADLDAVEEFAPLDGLDWNGQVLRLTRRSSGDPAEGVRVVGWTRREGRWLRWQSPPVVTRGELQAAWELAGLWAQNPSEELQRQQVAITPLDEWQIFFFRGNAWTNPQSSAGTAPATVGQAATPPGGTPPPPAPATTRLPDGVRLVLQLPPGRALSGRLQRDWVRS